MGRKRKFASRKEYDRWYRKKYESAERASKYRCECDNVAVKRIHGCWVCQRCLDLMHVNWHKHEETHERLEPIESGLLRRQLNKWFKRNNIKWEWGGGVHNLAST